MSIKAMKRALDVLAALDTLFSPAARDSTQRVWINEAKESIEALRTAIQQAEAQQPATPEPVVSRNPFASRCYTMSESHLSGHRLIVGFEKLGDAQDAHEWVARQGRGDFTNPAPSVPDDVVRDAERYRWLRKSLPAGQGSLTVLLDDRCNGAFHKAVFMESLDASIDAAMLAASPAQKGGE